SGAFEQVRRDDDEVVLARRAESPARRGNVASVELARRTLPEALELRARGEVELVTVQPTSTSAPAIRGVEREVELGPPAWTVYLVFDHTKPQLAQRDLRLALAHAIDRDSLDLGPSFLPGTGG